jgi:MFS family permease
VAEAGYFPGIVLYLTYWIRQKQLAQMLALFITASPIANMLGGSISGMILDHVHWLGLSSWRWLLILEGAPAIVGGILTYFVLPARPADANFLTAPEKNWIAEELAHEEREKTSPVRISTSQTLTNGRVWHLTIIYFMAMISWNGLSLWMPQMMKAISAQFSNTTVGLLVMIPFFCAVMMMIFVARSSDRTLERRYHVVVPLFFGGGALTLLAARTASSVPIIVALWCVGAAGTCSIWGPFWALPNEFLTGYSAAAGIAMINSIGNLGGFFGSYTIGALSKRSGNYGSALAFLAASFFAGAILMVALPKDRG